MSLPRIRADFLSGTLTSGLTDSQTDMNSEDLADFPEVSDPQIMAVTLDPRQVHGDSEIVWITDHNVGATPSHDATILRGQEGTTARAHPINTKFTHGPTSADFIIPKGSIMSGQDVPYYFNEVWGDPEGYDFEFNRVEETTPDSDWTWVNQDSATFIEHFGAGRIDWSGGGDSDNVHMLVTDLPTDLVSADFYAHMWGASSGTGNYAPMMIFRNSANGQFLSLAILARSSNNNEPRWFVNYYTDPDTYSSSPGSAKDLYPAQDTAHCYMHVVANSATDWDFYVNHDGGCDFTVVEGVNPTSLLGAVPDQVGYGVTSTDGVHTGCEWIRIRNIVAAGD